MSFLFFSKKEECDDKTIYFSGLFVCSVCFNKKTLCEDGYQCSPMFGSIKKKKKYENYLWSTKNPN